MRHNMANKETFLNFRIPDTVRDALDDAAAKSGCTRSQQARMLIEFALGIEYKPYIPVMHGQNAEPQLSFMGPRHGAPVSPMRRRRTNS